MGFWRRKLLLHVCDASIQGDQLPTFRANVLLKVRGLMD